MVKKDPTNKKDLLTFTAIVTSLLAEIWHHLGEKLRRLLTFPQRSESQMILSIGK